MESLDKPKTLVDQAYEVILGALCDGTFRADERLTQEEIAARLNVSRQPVTHALEVLKAQGFLAKSGRQGLTVTRVNPEFFKAIYELRSAIEPLAVRLATPRLNASAVAAAHAIIERGRRMVAANDAAGGLQADIDFHSFIYELSGNPLIADTMRLHWHHLRRAMLQVLRYPGMSDAVWNEHEQILHAMMAANVDGACELVRKHLVDAFERVGNSEGFKSPATETEA
jgi:DNA-binding GntR family transcriptional regulator